MVRFNHALSRAVVSERRFGRAGAPWEFNLRDVLRWCELAEASVELPAAGGAASAAEETAIAASVFATFPVIYLHRMRTGDDRAHTHALFAAHFPSAAAPSPSPAVVTSPDAVRVGVARLQRASGAPVQTGAATAQLLLLREQLPALEAATAALSQGWMAVLVGPAASGKTALARSLASLAGARLHEVRCERGRISTPLLGLRCAVRRGLELTKQKHSALSDGGAHDAHHCG